MSRLRKLAFAQRVVLVIALAAFLHLGSIYIVTDGFSGPRGGWFAYAPDTDISFETWNRLSPAASWFVYLGALAIWTVASLWLMGAPPADDHDD